MPAVLFVDDERSVLDGLRRALFMLDEAWECAFACGGFEAIKHLEDAPVDIVVTDMRMPVMDGAELLRCVQERWPSTVRIVLSGHSELEQATKALRYAHQFLAKPCSSDTLVEVLERTQSLSALVKDDALRRYVHGVGALAQRSGIQAALSDDTISPDALTALIQQDVGTMAKVLQIANSAFFGIRQQICTVDAAVKWLGAKTLRGLLARDDSANDTPHDQAALVVELDTLSDDSRRVAQVASELSPEGDRALAQVAGMLHDVGYLALAADTQAARDSPPCTRASVTKADVLSAHAEAGACLVGLWGLPASLVTAVRDHHAERAPEPLRNNLNATIQLAVELLSGLDPLADRKAIADLLEDRMSTLVHPDDLGRVRDGVGHALATP